MAGEIADAISAVINGNLGYKTETGSSSGSVLARLADLETKVGATGDAANSTGSVFARLAYLAGKGVIKSIQRGSANVNSSSVSVTITSVDTSKSFLVVTGDIVPSANINSSWYGYISSSTSLVFATTSSTYLYGTVRWEVIEYA